MTPLMVQIGIHYVAMADDFRDLDAPAIKDAIEAFRSAGLLRPTSAGAAFQRLYQPTDGLRIWVDAICSVPWPEQKWSMPATGTASVGARGGRARAAALSPERRSEIARQGAAARWSQTPATNSAAPATHGQTEPVLFPTEAA